VHVEVCETANKEQHTAQKNKHTRLQKGVNVPLFFIYLCEIVPKLFTATGLIPNLVFAWAVSRIQLEPGFYNSFAHLQQDFFSSPMILPS